MVQCISYHLHCYAKASQCIHLFGCLHCGAVALRSFKRRRAITSMHIVYILQSQKDKSYYVGYTFDNVQKRINQHNSHSNKYSSSKAPFELIWYCVFNDKNKALKFEKYLKQGSGFAFRNKHLI
jgi:putative endonuclease